MKNASSLVAITAWIAFACSLAPQAQAAGDVAKGEAVFTRCQLCHSANKGGGNGLGPNLFGVVGRKAASVPNFYYSPALKNANITWTEDMLRKWVTNPQKMVPGTRMVFAGLPNSKDADDVVAFLKSKK
jgi:cytochrome c